MAKHRTPKELLAEALSKVAALQTKVAEDTLRNHPRMASLLDAESEVKKELSKANRWLCPEKGLEMRIAKLTSQIDDAKHKLLNAVEIQAKLKNNLLNIQEEKAKVASELASDGALGNV